MAKKALSEVSLNPKELKDFLNHIIAVDGSIQEYPGNRNEVSFIKKYVVDDLSDSESEVTLDELVRGLDSSKKNLLKLDIEGSEYSVIDSTPDYVFDKVGKILLEYHWPQGRLEAIVERFIELGFNYKFEDGKGYDDENGTVFFYRG